MRKELFNAIKARLEKAVPEVVHVDLWNHNVEFLEQEDGWGRPAVFVEIGEIEWSPLQTGGYRGRGTVRTHIVTDWVEGGYDAAFDLSRKIRLALDGLRGEDFDGMMLGATATNHNHEDIMESIDAYMVRYQMREK